MPFFRRNSPNVLMPICVFNESYHSFVHVYCVNTRLITSASKNTNSVIVFAEQRLVSSHLDSAKDFLEGVCNIGWVLVLVSAMGFPYFLDRRRKPAQPGGPAQHITQVFVQLTKWSS